MKIKKGDKVLITRGKDRNKTGTVIKALPKKKKVVVEGLNLAKKHMRPRRSGEKGQIIQVPMPLDISKVKLICPKCNKPTRVGYKFIEGRKYRQCKKCNNTFE